MNRNQNVVEITPRDSKTKKLSMEALKFLDGGFPWEQVEEISPVLQKWRNRRILKGVNLNASSQGEWSSSLIPTLIRILRQKGIAWSQESSVAAWLLGLCPRSEKDRRDANDILILTLTKSAILPCNRPGSKLLKSVVRSYMLTFFCTSAILSLLILGFASACLGVAHSFSILATIAISYCCFALIVAIPLYPVGAIISYARDEHNHTVIHSYVCKSLARLGYVASIGALSTAALRTEKRNHTPAYKALIELLPKVTAENTHLAPSESVPNLSRLLTKLNPGQPSKSDLLSQMEAEELSLDILKFLWIAGDGRSLRAVTQVANTGLTQEIRSKASELSPVIQERARLENDRSMLLRGSQKPDDSETLLKPATYVQDTNEDELLRSSAKKGS